MKSTLRQSNSSITLIVISVLGCYYYCITVVSSFSNACYPSRPCVYPYRSLSCRHLLYAVQAAKRKEPVSMTSSFWYARETPNVTSSVDIDQEEYYSGAAVPYDPYLDNGEGPLMPGAYRSFPSLLRENFDKKPCLITVGLNFERKSRFDPSELDAMDVVKRIQACIDHGFNSFQISNSNTNLQEWGESNAFGLLRRSTPLSVLRNCVFASRIQLPTNQEWSPQCIRDQVSSSLIRSGSDCIDLVQVSYDKESPYYLDTIDALIELQREGKILAIGGINMSSEFLLEVSRQFGDSSLIDNNQVPCNVVDQRNLNSMQPHCKSNVCKMVVSNSNLGGLLRKKYLEEREQPKRSQLRTSEQRQLEVIQKWANGATKQNSWQMFRERCLVELQNIGDKYEVPLDDVALRWAMELDALGSVVVDTTLLEEDKKMFPSTLRKAFKIELDQDDREIITKIAQLGTTGIKTPTLNIDEEEFFMLQNKKLWL